MRYKVVLVDDEKMVLNSLALGIDWQSCGFEIIKTCTNSVEAFNIICNLKPNVAFVDMKMPHLNGLELIKKLKAVLPKLKFVMISGYAEFAYVQKALSYGACAYCLKPFEDDELYEILSMVKEKLDDEQNILESTFIHYLESRSNSDLLHVTNILNNEGFHSNTTALAISINSISDIIDEDINYLEILHSSNEYFYIFDNLSNTQNIKLQIRIKKLIADNKIKNYSICYLKNFKDNISLALDALINNVYTFFYTKKDKNNLEITSAFINKNSTYIKKIEVNACKNNIVEVLDLLSNYKTMFGDEELDIKNILKLYNICLSLLYRLDDNYFEDFVQTENSLTSTFDNFNLMMDYLIKMLSEYSSNKINMDLIKNDTFRQILEYINKNFTDEISFQQICYTYSINPSYLSQIFKKEIGITFTNYITQLRINYAKELLTNTNLLISEISEKVGYKQYFYFAKIFKKTTSMSAKQYRDENCITQFIP